MLDRRVYPRSSVDLPATTIVDVEQRPCRVVEISPSGLVFESDVDMKQDEMPMVQRVDLAVSSTLIRVVARTVWVRAKHVALKFIGLHDVDRLEIAEELDRAARA